MKAELLKPAEVAVILRVSMTQAYNLLKRGDIPSVRIGTSVRVRWEDLERYINEKAGKPTTDEAK